MHGVTVAVVPRDRFSKTGLTVRRVIENTPQPYRLVIVDAGMPKRYRVEVERLIDGHPNVEVLRTDKPLDSNSCKNWVIREDTDCEFMAMVENDNEVRPGWLEKLIRACDDEQAEVARPMILEQKLFRIYPHFDPRLGKLPNRLRIRPAHRDRSP